jgi:hypothetical protein
MDDGDEEDADKFRSDLFDQFVRYMYTGSMECIECDETSDVLLASWLLPDRLPSTMFQKAFISVYTKMLNEFNHRDSAPVDEDFRASLFLPITARLRDSMVYISRLVRYASRLMECARCERP